MKNMQVLDKHGKRIISIGPWGGGLDGFHWDDGLHSTVRQLQIVHGVNIDSIRIEYDKDGTLVWSEKHGGSGGTKIDKIMLDWPDEFLTSMHGHYGNLQEWGPVCVRSLTFESNKRSFGPYGIEEGTLFSIPSTGYKIIGFHGNCGWYLDSIGVHLQLIQAPTAPLIKETKNEHIAKIEVYSFNNVKRMVKSGTWGGNGGSLFDDGAYDGVRQIILTRNVGIVSIQICYEQKGQYVWGSKNGGTGAFKSDTIFFDYPSELLTQITGYHGLAVLLGPEVIKSLTFYTTKGIYGPFGEAQGRFFSSKLREGSVIVGFHGRKGLFIDAIGVHAASDKHMQTNERIVKNPAPYGPGPWGGDGGHPWDDGVFTGVKQIVLTRTNAICCMEIEYDRYGQSVWSVKHGCSSKGQATIRVKFEFPFEVLTCISGYYCPIRKDDKIIQVIQSLSFYTSRGKYGPFGEEIGRYFSSGVTEGMVVGFHGRSSMYLDAIGVHMQHWLGHQRPIKPLLG